MYNDNLGTKSESNLNKVAAAPDSLKWQQKIYREVVGVRRYETWAAVPMEGNQGA